MQSDVQKRQRPPWMPEPISCRSMSHLLLRVIASEPYVPWHSILPRLDPRRKLRCLGEVEQMVRWGHRYYPIMAYSVDGVRFEGATHRDFELYLQQTYRLSFTPAADYSQCMRHVIQPVELPWNELLTGPMCTCRAEDVVKTCKTRLNP